MGAEAGCYFCAHPDIWRVHLQRAQITLGDTCPKHMDENFFFCGEVWSCWRTPKGQMLFEEMEAKRGRPK